MTYRALYRRFSRLYAEERREMLIISWRDFMAFADARHASRARCMIDFLFKHARAHFSGRSASHALARA